MKNDKKKKINLINQQAVDYALDCIINTPVTGEYTVTIEPVKKKRTISQNALYWVWMGLIAEKIIELKNILVSAEDMHEWFKRKLLPKRQISIDGNVELISQSTTKLTTKEFSEYMEKIDSYCVVELCLLLPTPQDLINE